MSAARGPLQLPQIPGPFMSRARRPRKEVEIDTLYKSSSASIVRIMR